MLCDALLFSVIAVIAAVFGFGGIVAGAASIAKLLFFVFLVIFIVTLLLGVVRGNARGVGHSLGADFR